MSALRHAITVGLGLPPPELQPNRKAHWSKKAKAAGAYRHEAKIETMIATGPVSHRWKRARVDVTARHTVERKRDRDNLIASLKSAIDGMVDAHLLADDHGVEWGAVEFLPSTKVNGITLTITEVEA